MGEYKLDLGGGICYSLKMFEESRFQALAGVVKLADTPDLGSGVERRGGSSPFARTINTILR